MLLIRKVGAIDRKSLDDVMDDWGHLGAFVDMIVRRRKRLDPSGELWDLVKELKSGTISREQDQKES